MKRYYLLVLIALLLGTIVSDTSAKTPQKRRANTRTTQVRSAAQLAEKLYEIDAQPTIESQLESQAKINNLFSSYGGKAGVNGAIKALKRHADKLSGGSTMDMVESAIINATIFHYQSTTLFKKMHENPALTVAIDNEMVAWLKLENKLQSIIAQKAYVETWGGSAARTAAVGGTLELKEQRHTDIKHLAALTPVTKKNEIRNDFDALKRELSENIKDDMPDFNNEAFEYAGDEYKNVYQDLQTDLSQIDSLIQTWIEARKQLATCFDNPTDVYYATDSFIKQLCKITKEVY